MRKNRFTLLIVSLAIILGISDSIWGQIGVLRPEYQPNTNPQSVRPVVSSQQDQPQIDLRRVDATAGIPGYIGNAGNVGLAQFGAGESVTISAHSILVPNISSHAANGNNADLINIGSTISQNIVMTNYNAGGKASGFLHVNATGPVHYNAGAINVNASGFRDLTGNAPSSVSPSGSFLPGSQPNGTMSGLYSTTDKPLPSGGFYFSPWDTELYNLAGPMWAGVDVVTQPASFWNNYTAHLYLSNHIPTILYHWGVRATEKGGLSYTTTRNWLGLATDSLDNGVNLVSETGQQGITTSAIVGTAGLPDVNKRYIRPTTVAVAGTNSFNSIAFNELRWWVMAHNLEDMGGGNWYKTTTYNNNAWPGGHAIQSGLVAGCGHVGNLSITLYEIGSWEFEPLPGPNRLNAAVQLLDGALVCVNGKVSDNTGAIGIPASAGNDAVTNALIVLPVDDRVTFRTVGDFQANMHHERDSLTSSAFYYVAEEFPDPDKHIYMYPKKNATSAHAFAAPFLGEFQNSSITSFVINAPIDEATTTIFGVYSDYNFVDLMADIHTTKTHDATAPFAPVGKDNNPGVIEIGPTTAGKSHYHIYSGGVLKNFEGCTVDANFTMNFGTAYGGFPKLHFDQDNDLSILNYGNNGDEKFCEAKIIFHAGSITALGAEIALAEGNGAFRVQALSDVVLNENAVLDATAGGTGNNLYLLSDGGNVITQKFDVKSDYVNPVGQGMITFWAEDRNPGGTPGFDDCANTNANRNSARGNLYLNDDVTVTRTGTSAGDTETNLVAANNIRTAGFDFKSESDKNDITNVVSRKGDIYLGYSNGNNKTFTYTISKTTNAGVLNIKSGYDDQGTLGQLGGGNIYFTQIDAKMIKDGTYPTNIVIPFSNEYICNTTWSPGRLHERTTSNNSMQRYEHAGIIGGIGRCGDDSAWGQYAGVLADALSSQIRSAVPSLKYAANNGILLLDAGLRGNIIMNQGSNLDFQANSADGFFRTRSGDIDMRGETNVDGLSTGKGLVFLADNGNNDKSMIGCDCEEESNNVYIQDFDFATFVSPTNNGSVYFGADNNIKLQYGGLRKDAGTWKDPFISSVGYAGGGLLCSADYHCDSNPLINKARPMILDYTTQATGGVGIVASDLIDIYKQMIYTGGSTAGMSPVPAKTGTANGITSPGGSLHGENVAGYGLYIKSQGNKKNWSVNPFEIIDLCAPQCPLDVCGNAFLHQVARVTFHDDARIYAENSKVYIGSPVIEVYGNLELNTTNGSAKNNQLLHLQTDSLILHDSLILDGNKWRLTTWSNLERNMPVIKLGHQRFTPPAAEDFCKLCFSHTKGGYIANRTALDTMVVTFRNDADLPRLHSLVADHTVLTFLTDSFDHVKGNPTIHAKIFTDTFKIRNQVELWSSADKTHEGHFELVSEFQMSTKDYAGIYSRHLHMEPIAPDCSRSKYSELWPASSTLDVISTATFGGFGTVHADVYAETIARIAPGYASLGVQGSCYEQKAGTLKMKDLRMDKGAELHYSIGNQPGFDGELADCIDVDKLVLRGQIDIYVEVRCEQDYEPGCYPIIRYNSVDDEVLNNLHLATTMINGIPLSLDFSEDGIVNLCVAEFPRPIVQREVILPQPPHGVTMFPPAGVHYVLWGNNFTFTLNYFGREEFEVYTDRTSDLARGVEVLTGTLNANGEHEYVLRGVKTEPIHIYIGPNTVGNESLDKAAVWSSGNTLYIRVAREDIASIYSVAGTLVNRIEVPEGGITLPLSRGAYVVTLKDGSVHKVIIR